MIRFVNSLITSLIYSLINSFLNSLGQALRRRFEPDGDVWVSQRNGFDGKLSYLRYFSHALTGVEIENLVKSGPNLKVLDAGLRTFPPYLALRWFFRTQPVN